MSMTAFEVFVTLYAVFAIIGVSILIYLETPSGKRWMNGVEDTGQVCYFTFTEEQRSRIKILINQYYNPESCDICNRYVEIHGAKTLQPPFKNCLGRKDFEVLKEAEESNNRMFEEIEKIINE